MNKDKIIKESKSYTKIISNNISVKSKYFSIYYEKATEFNKYGITIPKKIGKAHTRNKIKRQIKNIIVRNENDIQKQFNYVIIIKEAILLLRYNDMEKELLNLFKKVSV